MTAKEVILDAIIRANKLGAQGTRVTEFVEPTSASQPWRYDLVCDSPQLRTASDKAWYEE